jgi:nucleotide-binding universal stress UspA family protein
MGLGSRVLVATDLSDAADEAIRQAHERARVEGGELVACHVIPNVLRNNPLFPQFAAAEMDGLVETEKRAAAAVEARVMEVTGRPLEGFRVHIDNGSPPEAIVRAADDVHATLVIVGSRGATGLERLLLGSVAERVVRYAHCPVQVARPNAKTGHVLAATDFSAPALPVIAVAAEEAKIRGARLTLLHSVDVLPTPAAGFGVPFGASWVVPPPELIDQMQKNAAEALRSELARFGVEGDVLAMVGNAGAAIVDTARTLPAELVVVATRGRTGIARMVLGSTAERVISLVSCSVLAVRHG